MIACGIKHNRLSSGPDTSNLHNNAKLHKRYTMLSYHSVRDATVSGTVVLSFIPGNDNHADMLIIHVGYT